MATATFHLPVRLARRMPDPTFVGAQRHLFTVRADDVPQGLPLAPNPRAQRTDRGVYKDVARSLLNEEGTPNTFHLKNKGITILAQDGKELGNSTYEVESGTEDGIVDGAHTYDIILAGQDRIAEAREA